jgi:hypothetical protein
MREKFHFTFNKWLYWTLSICIALAVKSFIEKSTISKFNSSIYAHRINSSDSVNYLINFADSITKKCPIYIDSLTTLLGVQSWGKTNLKFMYSLDIDTSKYDLVILKSKVNGALLNLLKTNSDFDFARDWNLIMEFNYQTPKGNFLFNFEYPPEKYK